MRFRWGAVAIGARLACILCIVCLALLPARTSQHARVAASAPYVTPTRQGFQIGPLRWELNDYASDAKLDPLRRFFTERCPGTVGLPAARCLTDQMARAFPHGPPKHEFVDAKYDPVTDLEAHMGGEPGHCVTRSGLVSAILLSSGIPARQLQIIPPHFNGHNVLEVFDARWGWVFFDPTYGTVFEGDQGPVSAYEALVARTPGHWSTRASSVSQAQYYEEGFRAQDLVYPDPWLYTRSGTRATSWPFRGLFVHAGQPVWKHGPAQGALRLAAVLFMLTALGSAVAARQRSRPYAATRTSDDFPESVVVPSPSVEATSTTSRDLEPRV